MSESRLLLCLGLAIVEVLVITCLWRFGKIEYLGTASPRHQKGYTNKKTDG